MPHRYGCNSCGLQFSLGSFHLRGPFGRVWWETLLICTECGTIYEIENKGPHRCVVRAESSELLSWQFGPAMPIVSDSSRVLPGPPGSKEEDERSLSRLKEQSDQAWHGMYEAGASSPEYRRLEGHWRSLMAEIRVIEERSAERALARGRIECAAKGHPLEPWPEPISPPTGSMRDLLADVLPWVSRDRKYQQTRLCRCQARGETRRVAVAVVPGRTLSKLTFKHPFDLENLQCAGCGQRSVTGLPTAAEIPAGQEEGPLRCPRCKQRTLKLRGEWRT